jgi:hypothetical protein
MSEENKDSSPTPESMEKAKNSMNSLFRSGMWNSALLAFFFGNLVAAAYNDGSYLMVGLGCLCTYLAVHDAFSFYRFYKLNKEVPTNG